MGSIDFLLSEINRLHCIVAIHVLLPSCFSGHLLLCPLPALQDACSAGFPCLLSVLSVDIFVRNSRFDTSVATDLVIFDIVFDIFNDIVVLGFNCISVGMLHFCVECHSEIVYVQYTLDKWHRVVQVHSQRYLFLNFLHWVYKCRFRTNIIIAYIDKARV